MGKSLLELLDLKDKGQIQPLDGDGFSPPPTPVRENIIPPKFGNVIKKYAGKPMADRAEAEAYQIKQFVKNAPKIYGLDAPRILLKIDNHDAKKALNKGAKAIGSVLGPIGKAVAGAVTNFHPKYPDDFLNGTEEEKNLSFDLYDKLSRSNYAGGKYYNPGVPNGRSILSNFVQGNRTNNSNLLPAAIGAGASLAVAGLKKLFGKKKKKGEKIVADEDEKKLPKFPSLILTMTRKTPYSIEGDYLLDRNAERTIIATNQQQRKNTTDFFWQNHIGVKAYSTQTGSIDFQRYDIESDIKIKNKQVYDLHSVYKNFTVEPNISGSAYFDRLHLTLDDKNIFKAVGTYSKDSLIIEDSNPDPKNPKRKIGSGTYTRYNTIKDFENEKPFYPVSYEEFKTIGQFYGAGGGTNYIISTLSGSIGPELNTTDNKLNYIEYNSINSTLGSGSVKAVRWNTLDAVYSKNQTDIYNADVKFVKESKQSFGNDTTNVNPYRTTIDNILSGKGDDIIKLSIGNISLVATLTGLTDTSTPNWNDVKAVGSGFKFYLYDSWEREISFKVQLYAQKKEDLDKIWSKANKIKQFTLPKSKGNLGVFGELIPLKIGDVINIPYGFLSKCDTTIVDNSPWEIDGGSQKPFIFEMDMTYKVVANKIDGYNFYS